MNTSDEPTSVVGDAKWTALAQDIAGAVVRPGDPTYSLLAPAWNARFDSTRPAAILRCAAAEDAAIAFSFARRQSMPIAVRSGGHSFAGQSSTSGLLIDTGRLNTIAVADGLVAVGAGTRLGALYTALDTHGLTLPGGTCPTVGIAGLTLGGGLGLLGRQHGLTSDRLRGADIVLTDGRAIHCDANHDPDLFWAMQGGGTSGAGSSVGLGIVTALTFEPVPAPTAAVTTQTSWAWPYAAPVIDAWQHLAPAAPGRLAASLKITVPLGHRGRPLVHIIATCWDDPDGADQLIEKLSAHAHAEPEQNITTRQDYPTARRYWANLDTVDPDSATETAARPVEPSHTDPSTSRFPETIRQRVYAKSEFFDRHLPARVAQDLLDAIDGDRDHGQARELDFMPWAAAYNRRRPADTAFAHRDDLFLLKHSVSIPAYATTTQQHAAQQDVEHLWERTHIAGTGRSFQNFADPDLHDPLTAYYGPNRQRLTRIRDRYRQTDGHWHPRS